MLNGLGKIWMSRRSGMSYIGPKDLLLNYENARLLKAAFSDKAFVEWKRNSGIYSLLTNEQKKELETSFIRIKDDEET